MFKSINYTEEDRLQDEIFLEETAISRLYASLGFAMTPVDLETILFNIELHEKRLKLLNESLQELNRHNFSISGKCR